MSAPSGKSIDPFDLSTYAPKRAPGRSALDQPPVEEDNKLAVLAPAYALRGGPQTGTSVEDQAPSPPPPNAVEGKTAENPTTDETEVDADLQRLASSLKRPQREGAVARLPRAVPLPPVSGLRPVAVEAPLPRREQFINGIRVPPSLAADRLSPPPEMWEWRDNLRGPLVILLVSAIAAPIAFYFAAGGLAPTSAPARKTELSAEASRLVTSTKFPIRKEGLRPSEAEDYNKVASSLNKLLDQKADSSQGATSPLTETQSALPLGRPPARDVLAGTVVRELDPEAIKLFMQQGEQFVASGDPVTARFLFWRAAEAGNAAAALALGATFDPIWLAKLGMGGVGGDIEKARSWYKKAKEFGSPDASRRLEMLADR